MKSAIDLSVAMMAAVLAVGCDETDSPTAIAPRPEMTIVDVDSENRSITITISNATEKAMLVSSSDGQSIQGAYWYSGNELVEAVECGTGFWDGSFIINAAEMHSFRVTLPLAGTPVPSRLTLAVVYGGHGAVTRDELPAASDEDFRLNLTRHPDLLMGCRKLEAEVFVPEWGEVGQDENQPTSNSARPSAR